ncbi:hypothetical protein MYP_2977 [Sporocytophaga myxococcoides]|uniref:Uncharacterized protein n=1 Tax=Sporocytophaga myxococcoides TaxID=153721 RepID=A0A098LIB4_9BACT|nr:hypothetical protein [Sporocytophaga myxococcoides]GAL85748.1 hypothetical protein MYP_2977 [Sporocytophaga myxococcoides]
MDRPTFYKQRIEIVHAQNGEWTSQLNLNLDELTIYQNKLDEIKINKIDKNKEDDLNSLYEKIHLKRKEIEHLLLRIKANENEAVYSGQVHTRRISYEASDEYSEIEHELEQFILSFKDLKNDFLKFLNNDS